MDVLRVFLIVIASAAMIGFGLCGAMGIFSGLQTGHVVQFGSLFLVCGAIGVALSIFLFFVVRKLIRHTKT